LVTIGAARAETIWNVFGMRSYEHWALCKRAIENEREELNEPRLYEHWEQLMQMLDDVSRRESGAKVVEGFTQVEQCQFVEEELFAGEEPPSRQ
jgi:hypothetical protein